jgi:limonene-1,2-epoxide hydrolase
MTMAPGTYFAKDRYTGEYQLVLDGEVIETVKTRKEARKWWERTMADLKRMEIAILREAKARRYALNLNV